LANIHIPAGTVEDAGRGSSVISSKIAQAPRNNRFAMTSSKSRNPLHVQKFHLPLSDLNVDLRRRQLDELSMRQVDLPIRI
jgi:hypothetical protein